MTNAFVSVKGHRIFRGPTLLNLRTQARYDRCEGQHKPSGQTISRDFGNHQRKLPICKRCGCPYGGPRVTSSRVRWNGTDSA